MNTLFQRLKHSTPSQTGVESHSKPANHAQL